MTSRRWWAALVATLVYVGLAVHGLQAAADSSRVATFPPGITWLAAGDSYSSGEGTATIRLPYSSNTCARSLDAYGPLAAFDLKNRGGPPALLTHVACTGSTVHEFLCCGSAANNDHGPQWTEAVTGLSPDTRFDVISMSFGGNDIGFVSIIQDCIQWLQANTWANVQPSSPACHVQLPELKKRIDNLLAGTSWEYPTDSFAPTAPGIGRSLADFYAYVANEKLTADGVFVVVGYPNLFAPHAQWNSINKYFCQSVAWQDAEMLNAASEYLDQKLHEAVTNASRKLEQGKITYVPLREVYKGHELCSTPQKGKTPQEWEFLNGLLIAGNDAAPGRGNVSFHPNKNGHQAAASRVGTDVLTLLGHGPSPAPQPTGPTTSPTNTLAPQNSPTTPATPSATSTPTTTTTPTTTQTGPPASQIITVDPNQWTNGSRWDVAGPAPQNNSGVCGRNSGQTTYRISLPQVNPGDRVVVRARISSADPEHGTSAWMDRVTPYVANGFTVDIGPDDGVGATYVLWDSIYHGAWFSGGPNLTEFNATAYGLCIYSIKVTLSAG